MRGWSSPSDTLLGKQLGPALINLSLQAGRQSAERVCGLMPSAGMGTGQPICTVAASLHGDVCE